MKVIGRFKYIRFRGTFRNMNYRQMFRRIHRLNYLKESTKMTDTKTDNLAQQLQSNIGRLFSARNEVFNTKFRLEEQIGNKLAVEKPATFFAAKVASSIGFRSFAVNMLKRKLQDEVKSNASQYPDYPILVEAQEKEGAIVEAIINQLDSPEAEELLKSGKLGFQADDDKRDAAPFKNIEEIKRAIRNPQISPYSVRVELKY